ncbi:MAG TPA: hypothetical protein P5132_02605 [Bacteroidales bacterium]|nr:hypothetical protein [Bacteroidales bacterium]
MNPKNLKTNKFILIVLFFIYSTYSIYAQEPLTSSSSDLAKLYKTAESIYTLNDELINGHMYPIRDTRIQGNPYLHDDFWKTGTVFIHNRQYPNVLVRYNLVIDELILKANINDSTERIISINKNQVDSFRIHNSLFVNTSVLSQNKKQNTGTYYELIYNNNAVFVVKKYEKRFIDMYNNITPYGKYSSLKSDIFLIDNDKSVNINKMRSLLNHFDKKFHKSIKEFIRNKHIDYRNISNTQLKELIEFCNSLTLN